MNRIFDSMRFGKEPSAKSKVRSQIEEVKALATNGAVREKMVHFCNLTSSI
jgi:hypothetical protein